MKKYSKGTTLVEIIVSLALISVVLVFMFNMLSDLKAEDRLSTKGSRDSIERASYMRIIQNDIIKKNLYGVYDENCSSRNSFLCLKLDFRQELAHPIIKELRVYKNKVVYDGETWELDSTEYDLNNATYCYKAASGTNRAYIKINIPTKANPNTTRKLDFELTFSTDKTLEIRGLATNYKAAC